MTADDTGAAEPAGPRGVDALLERVRRGLPRLGAPQAAAALAAEPDALLVDTRYAALRDRDGLVPGALIVERNELEWRLDPVSDYRVAALAGPEQLVVVFCNEGYASSFAAESLRRLGLRRATDLVGGFQAWRAAGLPVSAPNTPHTLTPPLRHD